MSSGYEWEKAFNAIQWMSTSPVPLFERLEGAWAGALIRLRSPEFIKDRNLRTKYDQLYERISQERETDGDHGAIYMTLRSMSEEELSETAEETFDIAYRLMEKHLREIGPE